MLPGLDGVDRLPPVARERRVGARAHAHGPRCPRGSRCRARCRRGRLSREAVLLRRAAGSAAGAGPPRRERATDDPRARRSPARSGDPPGLARLDRGSALRRRSSRCWRHSCVARGRCSHVSSSSSTPGIRVREALERRPRVRAISAGEDRPSVRASVDRDGSGRRIPAPQRCGSPVTRVPIRLRLTLVFAGVMAVVLVALGAFLYVRLGSSLDERIGDELESRSVALASVVRASGVSGIDPALLAGEEGAAQVIGLDGAIELATPAARRSQLLVPSELAAARRGAMTTERGTLRLRADPVGDRVVVVGESLEDRDEALTALRTQLLVALPLVLLASSFIGYLVAGAALRPVEAMRIEAEAISASRARAAPAAPRSAGRDPPAGRDAERYARAARFRSRARARVRRGCEPRAPHTTRAPPDGARARTSTASHARRTRAGAPVGGGRDGPPRAADGEPPSGCAVGSWSAATAARAHSGGRAPRRGRTPIRATSCGCRANDRGGRPVRVGASSATGLGWRKRLGTSSTTPSSTDPARCVSPPRPMTDPWSCT